MSQSIDQIAAQLQGYDPQALSAGHVNLFLARGVKAGIIPRPVAVEFVDG